MQSNTLTLLIIWHSRTGAARQMATAAADGARAIAEELRAYGPAPAEPTPTEPTPSGATSREQAYAGPAAAEPTSCGPSRLRVRLLPADAVQPADLLGADAFLFAAPENLAALSGAMKECLDRNYYPVLDRLNGRPYALIITAGSDGDGARRQIERICTGWRLRLIAPALIVPMHAQTPEAILAPKTVPAEWLARGAELGGTLAALLL